MQSGQVDAHLFDMAYQSNWLMRPYLPCGVEPRSGVLRLPQGGAERVMQVTINSGDVTYLGKNMQYDVYRTASTSNFTIITSP